MNFRELREELTDEQIKEILGQFNVSPVLEDESSITFPTCCHNLEGGSPKLVYYKNTKLFHCYTECAASFDIFTLLQKMYALRGEEISLKQAVGVCGLDTTGIKPEDRGYNCMEDIRYMQEINNYYIPDISPTSMKTYDKSVLNKFTYDYMGLWHWMQEGMSLSALQRFHIMWDAKKQALIIPNFDYYGQLIGIRGRFFNEEDVLKGKYRPIYDSGILYNHPTGQTFYGIYENHKNIERKKTVVIFEGEKSVILFETIYGEKENIALATLGQNITKNHIQYLLKMKVTHVILAYDVDYEDYDQLRDVEKKYREKAQLLSPYFNVSYLIDEDFLLPYKSSPIEGGKEIFETLLANRVIV